jgi:hypothetical protein
MVEKEKLKSELAGESEKRLFMTERDGYWKKSPSPLSSLVIFPLLSFMGRRQQTTSRG